ncbi:thermonuclease family protein [Varunaivibrio sulfuroxidans]|uniref:Endonuclease YncB(Thermonuclease family) n=1 Tax=Varunaivibrio sulfuroxidans TaxID=1773489 RepID=A0A4R3JJ07_9PROT|nr:thermonuclease family protein [Varunaivibrio sulfuroxidans]TCS64820.1 endonuclease YncB(thermonuclease family) [Varunaivibrio sulfuroxidans]WES29879.1 thermonuclease family protein [Varunaivibrio sulfuroxidans]
MNDRVVSDNLRCVAAASVRCLGVFVGASRCRLSSLWSRRLVAAAIATIFLWSAGGPSRGCAKEVFNGPLSARPVAVHDGDTLTVRARIWLDQEVVVRVRIAGIDAPELHGKCRREAQMAIVARDTLAGWIGAGPLMLSDLHYGKYAGRVIAVVTLPDGRDAAEALIAAHLARAYRGGRRAGWC